MLYWLHKNMSIPSIDSSYSHALRTIQSGAKLVWNNVTNKATCERNFGKDALLLAINEELKQNCLTGEKANSIDEEKEKEEEEDVLGEKEETMLVSNRLQAKRKSTERQI